MILAQVLIDRFLRSKRSEQEYDLNPYEKLVLFFLASYMGDNPSCHPSIKTLAKNCSVSSATIKRSLKSIEKKELIKIQRTAGDSNHYFFTLPDINQPVSLGTEISQHPDANSPPVALLEPGGGAISTGFPQHLGTDGTIPLAPIEPGGGSVRAPNNINNNISEYTSSQEREVDTSPAQLSNSTKNAYKQLFEYWQTVMNHPRALCDPKRKRCITKALQNYSVENLKQAIDGCKNTPYNMGQNDRHQVYDEISLIFRDAEHIERFMNNAERKNRCSPSITSNDLMAGVI